MARAAANGNKLAQAALDAAPKLEFVFWWNCYWEMSSMRPPAFSEVPCPVPLDKIHWYADAELALTCDEKREYVWIMRAVDHRMIQIEADAAKGRQKKH